MHSVISISGKESHIIYALPVSALEASRVLTCMVSQSSSFSEKMNERIQLPQFASSVIHAIVNFLNHKHDGLDSSFNEIKPEIALELMVACDYLEIRELEKQCMITLAKNFAFLDSFGDLPLSFIMSLSNYLNCEGLYRLEHKNMFDNKKEKVNFDKAWINLYNKGVKHSGGKAQKDMKNKSTIQQLPIHQIKAHVIQSYLSDCIRAFSFASLNDSKTNVCYTTLPLDAFSLYQKFQEMGHFVSNFVVKNIDIDQKFLSKIIPLMPNMNHLDISSNNLNRIGGLSIADGLRASTGDSNSNGDSKNDCICNITGLNLSKTNITCEAIRALAGSLVTFEGIKYVDRRGGLSNASQGILPKKVSPNQAYFNIDKNNIIIPNLNNITIKNSNTITVNNFMSPRLRYFGNQLVDIKLARRPSSSEVDLKMKKDRLASRPIKKLTFASNKNDNNINVEICSSIVATTTLNEKNSLRLKKQENKTESSLFVNLFDNPIGDVSVVSLADTLSCRSRNLSILILSRNKLGEEAGTSLADVVKHSTHLTHLDVSYCEITSVGLCSIINSCCRNKNLVSLDISNNVTQRCLTCIGISLGKMIQQNTSITSLNISGNYFTHSGLDNFVSSLASNYTLYNLNMRSLINFDSNVVKLLVDSLTFTSSMLGRLNVSHNNIPSEMLQPSCECLLENNITLTSIDLSNNYYSVEVSTALQRSLSRNNIIKQLNLSSCDESKCITSFGFQNILDGLLNNSSLTYLDLSNQGIKNEGAIYLSRILNRLTTLSILVLKKNKIRNRGALILVEYIRGCLEGNKNNISLRTLDLGFNYIDETTIPLLEINSDVYNFNMYV